MSSSPETEPNTRLPVVHLILGIVGLSVAMVSSIALSMQHLGGFELPGCGGDSPCAQLSDSFWGKVPGTAWPVSFIGAAYFAGALTALILGRGRLSSVMMNIARLGMVFSLLYIGIMISKALLCEYCAIAHAGNLIFWAAAELAGRAKRSPTLELAGLVVPFAAMSIIFGVLNANELAKLEEQRQKSVENILAEPSETAEAQPAVPQPAGPTETESPPATKPQPLATSDSESKPQAEAKLQPQTASATPESRSESTTPEASMPAPTETAQELFTGRRKLGPEKALVRIVTFSDFQCKTCGKFEKDVMEVLEKYPEDVNFSMKHFPTSVDCNPYTDRNIHPNACWAARAAEAAAILYGDDVYWKFHHWIFERQGSFTAQQLNAFVSELGYEPREFANVMTSDETLARVTQDLEEGYALGLNATPFVFINGVEFKGWSAERGLQRTLDQIVPALRQRNRQPADARGDRPPLANKKFVNDYLRNRKRPSEPDPAPWTLGEENAPLQVVMWGDYQERRTKLAWETLLEYANKHRNVRLHFRHFPVNTDCNAGMKVATKHPQACRMARAAEIAGALGGEEAFFAMHSWLLANGNNFSTERVSQYASTIGLDPAAMAAAVEASEEADAKIDEDVNAGLAALIRAVPLIRINDRTVGLWQRQGDATPLKLILDAALKNP